MHSNLSIVILAAGRGSRLMPHTRNLPKCLVKLGGHPILFYQLKALEKAKIKDISIVVGYRGGEIKLYTKKYFPQLNINFFENKFFSRTTDIDSLYLLKNRVALGVIQLNSDVLFHPEILSRIANRSSSALCFQRKKCQEEETKVIVDPLKRVIRYGKTLDPQTADGESIGIHFFSADFMDEIFKLTEQYRESKKTRSRDSIISEVISSGKTMAGVDVSRYPAIEIDFPHDLKRAVHVLTKILASNAYA